MLPTSLFQNQILGDFYLKISEFNFVLHLNLISCYFLYLLYGLAFILDFMGTFSLKEKDVISSKSMVNVSCFKGVF